MGVFKNEVGRPSNEVVRTRNIFKTIGCAVLVCGCFALGYFGTRKVSENKEIVEYQNKEENSKFDSIEEVSSDDKENENYNPKESFNKFANNNKLTVYKDGQGYDLEALKKMDCKSAIRASSNTNADNYSVEIFEFNAEDSAKKYYDEQVNYQKTEADVVQIYERKVLTEKSESNYDMFEIKSVVEDINGSSNKNHDYYYNIRINNYCIVIFSSNNNDNINDMIKLKEELNSLLNVK